MERILGKIKSIIGSGLVHAKIAFIHPLARILLVLEFYNVATCFLTFWRILTVHSCLVSNCGESL